jgi:hypothetical protein
MIHSWGQSLVGQNDDMDTAAEKRKEVMLG